MGPLKVVYELTEAQVKKIAQEAAEKALELYEKKSIDPFSIYPDLLTRHQASKILGCSTGTIDRLARKGALTKLKRDDSVRINKAEVLNLYKAK